MTVSQMYVMLCELGYTQAADCLSSVNGFTEETMQDVLYWATGYHDFEQYINED